MTNGPSFMFSPKCVSNDPIGVAGTLGAVREIDNDSSAFLYWDCLDTGCNCCVQVIDCPGVVSVHSLLQVNIYHGSVEYVFLSRFL